MAKKKSPEMSMAVYHEPSPKQELDYALDRAVEKAVLAHPRTQKLRETLKQRMAKAAGNGENGTAEKPKKAKRS